MSLFLRLLVDGVGLDEAESRIYLASLAAATTGITTNPRSSILENRESVSQCAHAHAAQNVREYRRLAWPKDDASRWVLASPQRRIEAWVVSRGPFSPVHLAVVRRLENAGADVPRTRTEIRDVARVRDEPIDCLVQWGILVDAQDASAATEGGES